MNSSPQVVAASTPQWTSPRKAEPESAAEGRWSDGYAAGNPDEVAKETRPHESGRDVGYCGASSRSVTSSVLPSFGGSHDGPDISGSC